jgi:ribonuclease T1
MRFQNRERGLPPGTYREYDVHPRIRGRDRGPERLVIDGASGRAYYTPDHYRTFVQIRE